MFLYYFVGIFATGIGAATAASLLALPVAIEAGVIGGGFLGTLALLRTGFARWSRKQRRQVTELIERLTAMSHRQESVCEELPELEAGDVSQSLEHS
jgi:hypothetical protein